MSVSYHRYWGATIDGRPARIVPANLAYQALVVPAGQHRVRLRYHNPLIAVGAVFLPDRPRSEPLAASDKGAGTRLRPGCLRLTIDA